MAGGSDIHVEGLSRAVRQLQSLGVDLGDLKNAFNDIANEAMPIYRKHTPVRSGRLRNNYRASRSKNRVALLVGGASVPYARVINYGWPSRGIAATDFVGEGDTELGPRALKAVEAEINRLIRTRDLG